MQADNPAVPKAFTVQKIKQHRTLNNSRHNSRHKTAVAESMCAQTSPCPQASPCPQGTAKHNQKTARTQRSTQGSKLTAFSTQTHESNSTN